MSQEPDRRAQAALDYHEFPTPGKISVTPTKPLGNQDDLSLAYSPGVAWACRAIEEDQNNAARFTSRNNLVGVVTNGSAVLGLGNIGPYAAKPVMEGKGCLFKKFSGIDVFDIELAETDPDKLIDIIAALEPTLGGINLEDIKAPECFYIEKKLRERMKIPVFHDDQHGTAIISSAAILNGLTLVEKDIGSVRLVCSGAGAAAIACLDLLVQLGMKKENILVCDSKGVITNKRDKLDETKARYAQDTDKQNLAEAIDGADIFLGCSAKGLLTKEMVKTMADKPLILALANPDPEITPEDAKEARDDVIIATGRSDYPNQVNNVLCFPFIFRGALDVGATAITENMKLACVHAIAELARAESDESVSAAYKNQEVGFGPDSIIPRPFDPRLIVKIAPAVAKAAMDDGVALHPIEDLEDYRTRLDAFTRHSGRLMQPLFAKARQQDPMRIIYPDAEDERILRAVQTIVDKKLARPVLIGRPDVIDMRIQKHKLRICKGQDYDIVDPENDDRFSETWQLYYKLRARDGITPEIAKAMIRKHNTLIGSLLIENGYAEGMVCGLTTSFDQQLRFIRQVNGTLCESGTMGAMSILILPDQTLYLCDTHVNENPTAEQLAEITLMAAEEMRREGAEPNIALISHSMFGSRKSETALKMARTRELIKQVDPNLPVEGEMQADAALSEDIRSRAFPDNELKGGANLLIFPTLDAAHACANLVKMTGANGILLGPVLLGAKRPVNILPNTATTRRIINMTALTVIKAQSQKAAE